MTTKKRVHATEKAPTLSEIVDRSTGTSFGLRGQVTEARLAILLELALVHHSADRKAEIRQQWDDAGKSRAE